jgi:hypothetical protein
MRITLQCHRSPFYSIWHSSSFRPMFVRVLFYVCCCFVWHPLSFCPTFIPILSNVHQCPSIRSVLSIWPFPSTNIRSSPFIPIDTPYSSNDMLCWNFVSSALYYYKILEHGTTPCPRMMRALSLSQNQGINYEVTHNHLSRFLWAHKFHNITIKRLQYHYHPV